MKHDYMIFGIERELEALEWHFYEFEFEFELVVNSTSVKFLKCDSDFSVKPNEWLRNKHQNGKGHEPGMIAVLSFLCKNIKSEIHFYDIGALFGYFSSIVKAMRPSTSVSLIEGNPMSCNCIKKISPYFS